LAETSLRTKADRVRQGNGLKTSRELDSHKVQQNTTQNQPTTDTQQTYHDKDIGHVMLARASYHLFGGSQESGERQTAIW